jgi:uncharacterized protein
VRAEAGFAVLARLAPFGLYMLVLAFRDALANLLGPQAAPWLYGLQVGLAFIAIVYFRAKYDELRFSAQQLYLYDVGLAVGVGFVIFVAWINLDLPYLSLNAGKSAPSPVPVGTVGLLWLVLRIVGAALIVPIMEELFWRSLVLRWLMSRGFHLADRGRLSLNVILMGSLVFGLEHQLWFAGWLAGIAYAWLYRRNGLWAAIIAHAVTNALLGGWVITFDLWQFW